jgi:hypothetical protein
VAFNASIVTDVAKEITKREVVNYGAGVYSHTTGDWSGHNVLRVYPSTPFEDDSGADVSTSTLRIVATLDDGSAKGSDLAFALPVNPSGETALTTSPPIIVRQPVGQVAPPGSTVQFSVAVISDIALTYTWFKDDEEMDNQEASTLILPSVTSDDAAAYKVTITNANGSVTSTEVNLTVDAGASGVGDEGFFEQLPQVRLFRRLFDLF